MKQQISTLQEQVNSLFADLRELRAQRPLPETPNFDISQSVSQPRTAFPSASPTAAKPRTKHPRFHGPTSSAFNFDVAKSSLQTMGITQAEDGLHDDLPTAHATPAGTPPRQLDPAAMSAVHPSKDPIWVIKREEAIRLCRVYEEEIGNMYPHLDIEKVIHQTNLLYTFLEAATRTGFAQRGLPGADSLQDDDTNILKMILATTLMVEGSGQSEIGRRLYETVKPVVEAKLWEPVDIKTIQLLALVVSPFVVCTFFTSCAE